MNMLEEPLDNDGQAGSASAETELAPLDHQVCEALTEEYRAFESVVAAAGITDSKAVREALLRLLEAGKAELSYGRGWRRAGVKP